MFKKQALAGLDDVAKSLVAPSRSEGLRVLALHIGKTRDYVHANPWLESVQLAWPLSTSDADDLSSYGVPLSLVNAIKSGRLHGNAAIAAVSYLQAVVEQSEAACDQLIRHRQTPLQVPSGIKQGKALVDQINQRCRQRMGEVAIFPTGVSADWTRAAASYELWICQAGHSNKKLFFSGMDTTACSYDLGGKHLTGGKLWAGSLLLIHWAASLVEERIVQMGSGPVLEVGSGIGVVGISLSSLFGISKMVLSDREPALLEVLNNNIEKNGMDDSCTVLELDWESVQADRDVADHLRAQHFSCVVGAEICYDPCHAELVADVVQTALHWGGVALFTGAAKHRPGVDAFGPSLRRRTGFHVVERSIPCGSVLQELLCGDFEPEQEYVAFLVHVDPVNPACEDAKSTPLEDQPDQK